MFYNLPIQEEFTRVKQRVQVVVVENEKLQEELKSRATHDALDEPSVCSFSVSLNIPEGWTW